LQDFAFALPVGEQVFDEAGIGAKVGAQVDQTGRASFAQVVT
jgi:hypothetical protein